MGNENSTTQNQSEGAGPPNIILLPPNPETPQATAPELGQTPRNAADVPRKQGKKTENICGGDSRSISPGAARTLAENTFPLPLPTDSIWGHAAEDPASTNPAKGPPDLTIQGHVTEECRGLFRTDCLSQAGEVNEHHMPASLPFEELVQGDIHASQKADDGEWLPPHRNVEEFLSEAQENKEAKLTAAGDSDHTTVVVLPVTGDQREASMDTGSSECPSLMQEMLPACSSEPEIMQLSKQLSEKSDPNPCLVSQGKEAGDDFTPSESPKDSGFPQAIHKEPAATQISKGDPDGEDGLTVKHETLIPNDFASGGCNREECRANGEAQNLIDNSEASDPRDIREANPNVIPQTKGQEHADTQLLVLDSPFVAQSLSSTLSPKGPSKEPLSPGDYSGSIQSTVQEAPSEKCIHVDKTGHIKEDLFVYIKPLCEHGLSQTEKMHPTSSFPSENTQAPGAVSDIESSCLAGESILASATECISTLDKRQPIADGKSVLEKCSLDSAGESKLSEISPKCLKLVQVSEGDTEVLMGEETVDLTQVPVPNTPLGELNERAGSLLDPIEENKRHINLEIQSDVKRENELNGHLEKECATKDINSANHVNFSEEAPCEFSYRSEQEMSEETATDSPDLGFKLVQPEDTVQCPQESFWNLDEPDPNSKDSVLCSPATEMPQESCIGVLHESLHGQWEETEIQPVKQDGDLSPSVPRETSLEMEQLNPALPETVLSGKGLERAESASVGEKEKPHLRGSQRTDKKIQEAESISDNDGKRQQMKVFDSGDLEDGAITGEGQNASLETAIEEVLNSDLDSQVAGEALGLEGGVQTLILLQAPQQGVHSPSPTLLIGSVGPNLLESQPSTKVAVSNNFEESAQSTERGEGIASFDSSQACVPSPGVESKLHESNLNPITSSAAANPRGLTPGYPPLEPSGQMVEPLGFTGENLQKVAGLKQETMCKDVHLMNLPAQNEIPLQSCNKPSIRAKEYGCPEQMLNKPKQVQHDLLISDIQHEGACQINVFPKETDTNQQPISHSKSEEDINSHSEPALFQSPGSGSSASSCHSLTAQHPDDPGKRVLDATTGGGPSLILAPGPGVQEEAEQLAACSCQESSNNIGTQMERDEDSFWSFSPTLERSGLKTDDKMLKEPGKAAENIAFDETGSTGSADDAGQCSGIRERELPSPVGSNLALDHPDHSWQQSTSSKTEAWQSRTEPGIITGLMSLPGGPTVSVAQPNLQTTALGVHGQVGKEPPVSESLRLKSMEITAMTSRTPELASATETGPGSIGNDPKAENVPTLEASSAVLLPEDSLLSLIPEIAREETTTTESQGSLNKENSSREQPSIFAIQPVPCLGQTSLSSKSQQEMFDEKKVAANLCLEDKPDCNVLGPACPENVGHVPTEDAESSNEKKTDVSHKPMEVPGCVEQGPRQACITTGLPDFREHINKIIEKSLWSTLNIEHPQLSLEERKEKVLVLSREDEPSFWHTSPPGQKAEPKRDGEEVALTPEVSCRVPEDMLSPQGNTTTEKQLGGMMGLPSTQANDVSASEDGPSLFPQTADQMERSEAVGVRVEQKVGASVEDNTCLKRGELDRTSCLPSDPPRQQPPLENHEDFKGEDYYLTAQENSGATFSNMDLIHPSNQSWEVVPNEKKQREGSPSSMIDVEGTSHQSGPRCAPGNSPPLGDVESLAGDGYEKFGISNLGNESKPQGTGGLEELETTGRLPTGTAPKSLEKQEPLSETVEESLKKGQNFKESQNDLETTVGEAECDIILSKIETEARACCDKPCRNSPETGTTRALFTPTSDSALQANCQDQGTETLYGSLKTTVEMEKDAAAAEYFVSMDIDVPLAEPECEISPHMIGRKSSLASSPEPGKLQVHNPQALVSEEFPSKRNFSESCHPPLQSSREDAVAEIGQTTSDEVRDDVSVASCPVAVDATQLASADLDNRSSDAPPLCGDTVVQNSSGLITPGIDQATKVLESKDIVHPVSEHLYLASVSTNDEETPSSQSTALTQDFRRSSDSEEAFETPESTTPVKASPVPVPPPPPEIVAEQEISPQQPPEDPGFGSEAIFIPDVPQNESLEGSPFRPPSHSFSTVFDEDKPIASSGTYNLDFDNIELIDTFQTLEPSSPDAKNWEPKVNVRRKSTDSVPVSRSTLSRSLSLQASDFDGVSYLGNNETVTLTADTYSTGSSSASSTLKRSKKPRPPSLKKKPATKKPPEAPQVKEPQPEPTLGTPEPPDPSEEKLESETKDESPKAESSGPPEVPKDRPDPTVGPGTANPLEPASVERARPLDIGESKVQNSPPVGKKTAPLSTAPEAVEVTPPDTGGQERSPPKGIAVRLEFDYSEDKDNCEGSQESPPPPKKIGKKPVAKMPLRRPKPKKIVEKLDNTPNSPTKSPAEPNDIPVSKGSYTFDIDKWDDPNFNPFSSTTKMQESPKLPQQTYSFDPNTCDDSIDPFKSSSKIPSSPSKSPASFEISANATETNGMEGDNLNKPAKKKKTPLKTMVEDVMSVCSLFDTFRVKKSPKRSPLSDPPSQDPTPLPTPETPPVITTVAHATDEEKLAVTNQKWTCMAVDLEADKQDYPQPSDLSTFVNETKFDSPTDELDYSNSYEIEYMEKIGSSLPRDDGTPKKQSLYLMFEAPQDTLLQSPPVRLSDSPTPCSGSSFEETEAQMNAGVKIHHPTARMLAPNQETSSQAPEKSKQKELESIALGTASDAIELTAVEDSFVSAEALLNRISHPTSLCDPLEYLEPDLAEKNPPIFAQKLQIEATVPADASISKTALYSRIGTSEPEKKTGFLYQQTDLNSALQIARAEIVTKEREVSEWKDKYEESRGEVMEMRKIVAEYEKTIAQMIEDEQREKSVSHHTVQQLIVEKEQALADLNSVEKSLADLFRRYEKMKEVLEGFRKNEEVLKKCAQEYLSRVKKEEQRYQALKIHAEEKLDRANAEIAQVRGKAQQEQAAYQASLRKEQLKVDALERTLEQKNKEIEELTKICDELIAKMGKS
ncbi:transforming acidic coiled-coil-containing protein 2 isoform X3 [Ornithorhynchus anatinus]|uniref:transforming acidic coiled-coil-containing protein 2 isoform X3 n=1 Tax=Ornithorhynchus anatinus TaxID=9258 RepID=UPI0010A821B1|nr:transforming acidic coiled-coil-containing protein 2 isoform X3 [Ornithorhynchus anatinus]